MFVGHTLSKVRQISALYWHHGLSVPHDGIDLIHIVSTGKTRVGCLYGLLQDHHVRRQTHAHSPEALPGLALVGCPLRGGDCSHASLACCRLHCFLGSVLHRATHHPVRRCLRRGMTKGIRNGKLPPRCFLRGSLVRRMFHQSNGTGGRCPPFYGFT